MDVAPWFRMGSDHGPGYVTLLSHSQLLNRTCQVTLTYPARLYL